jgi:hypothetical protein
MAFTNYTSFVAVVENYLARTDLSAQIPDFINLAQQRLTRELRTRPMLKVATTTANSADGTVELPSDFLELREIHFQGNPEIVLTFQTPDLFFRNLLTNTGATPVYYTLLSGELQFAPVPSDTLTLQMLYYAQPDFISPSTSTNLYLQNYPDALLYATLAEAEPYLMNDARIQTWATMYERAVSNIMKNDDGSKYPNVPLNVVVK